MGRLEVAPLELDCASTLFALGRAPGRAYVIRLAATLREPVDRGALQAALEATAAEYPYFFVRIEELNGRLFAVPAAGLPPVGEKDLGSRLSLDGACGCEAQVSCSGATVLLDYFHGVSDGAGGLAFLTRLLAHYVALTCEDANALEEAPVMPLREQATDGYRSCARGARGTGRHGAAYRLKRVPASEGVAVYRLSASEVRERARRYGASVTWFLAALLACAIRDLQWEVSAGRDRRPVRLAVPVDLRQRLSCRTMRNFTLSVYPELRASEPRDVGSVCVRFGRQLEGGLRPERLAGRCAVASWAAGSALVGMLSPDLRRGLVKTALDHPLAGSTMTFSNLGAVSLPEAVGRHVAALQVAFSSKPEAPYSCGVVSFGDEMRLTLVREMGSKRLERHIERVLSSQAVGYVALG